MPLVPVAPGAWENPEHVAGQPGLYAVIVGISKYRHLDGTQTTYGLGPLYTSATAAWRIFDWLRTEHRGPAPLAKVWVLLAPTDAELQANPALAENVQEPTFDALEEAIGLWDDAMRTLPKPSAEKSQSFLFFSGHGLEIHQDQQILLPADYLKPPGRNVNKAIGTNALRHALATLQVPSQLYFLDACRNDHSELRKQEVEGTPVLNVAVAGSTNPLLASPVFYATTAGEQAWQRKTPARGTSIFGDALLAGLRASPGLRLEPSPIGFAVTVFPLQKFLKAKMAAIHQELGSTALQPLVLTGNVDDVDVTWVEAPAEDATEGPLAFADAAMPRFAAPMAAAGALDPRGAPSGDLHTFLGHEWLTDPLRGARFWARHNGTWTPAEFDLRAVERAFEENVVRVEIAPRAHAEAWWLLLGEGEDTVACVLPGDAHDVPLFRVELVGISDADRAAGLPDRITRLRAGLSLANSGPLGAAALQWDLYETESIGDALAELPKDPHTLVDLIRSKGISPLAAVVSAVLVLRGRPRRVWDQGADVPSGWLPNLTRLFPWLPDGAALWAWQALGRDGGDHACREAMALLAPRGLPWTADGLAFAADALPTALVSWTEDDEPTTDGAPPTRHSTPSDIGALDTRLKAALRWLRPGGLFATFSGPAVHLTPAILGEPVEST